MGKEKSINPKFNHKQQWDLVVDDELVQYLATDVLELEVYGSSDTIERNNKPQQESKNSESESKQSKASGHAMAAAAAMHKAANDTRVAGLMMDMDNENAATAAAL